MLTTGSTRLAVSRGRQTWYLLGPLRLFAKHVTGTTRHNSVAYRYVTFILAVRCSSDATGLYILRRYVTN